VRLVHLRRGVRVGYRLLATGRLRVDDLTTAVVPLTGALEAIDSLRAAQTMKVLIDPRDAR